MQQLKADHDEFYQEYCKKRDKRKAEIEVLINSIWWKLNKIVWDDKKNSIEVHVEDQGGWPFMAFSFSLQLENWLDYLEKTLKIIKEKQK